MLFRSLVFSALSFIQEVFKTTVKLHNWEQLDQSWALIIFFLHTMWIQRKNYNKIDPLIDIVSKTGKTILN